MPLLGFLLDSGAKQKWKGMNRPSMQVTAEDCPVPSSPERGAGHAPRRLALCPALLGLVGSGTWSVGCLAGREPGALLQDSLSFRAVSLSIPSLEAVFIQWILASVGQEGPYNFQRWLE